MRPVCHRASTVEIIVPYGDPRPPFNRKCAFDAMDYGLGACANSLELGCDCLGAIQYFDGVVTTGAGEALHHICWKRLAAVQDVNLSVVRKTRLGTQSKITCKSCLQVMPLRTQADCCQFVLAFVLSTAIF